MDSNLLMDNYDYDLPSAVIAKYPLVKRDESKQLVYHKGKITDDVFKNLTNHLPSKTLLVFNDTKTIYARLIFKKESGVQIEVFILEPLTGDDIFILMSKKKSVNCIALIGNAKKLTAGCITNVIDNISITVKVIEKLNAQFKVSITWDVDISFSELIEKIGKVPLPPYLNRDATAADEKAYQTIYATHNGSIATPTAGLHFTKDVFDSLSKKGIKHLACTLHVGAGTFIPVKTNDAMQHQMHAEEIIIDVAFLKQMIKHNGKITAVGTTSCRLLESLYWLGLKAMKGYDYGSLMQWEYNTLQQESELITWQQSYSELLKICEAHKQTQVIAKTQIMITPGYKFKVINALITNFHQPKSTLLLLISAIVGDDWRNMYKHALANSYRFLSYGDSSLIKL